MYVFQKDEEEPVEVIIFIIDIIDSVIYSNWAIIVPNPKEAER